jgi:hypothetical protein
MKKMSTERVPNREAIRQWFRRVDRFAADLNVVLVMFVIGLAILDVTFLVSHEVLNDLPAIHVVHGSIQDGPSPSPAAPSQIR